jgi:hypothetical protein
MPTPTKVCFSLHTTQSVIQTFPQVLTLLIVNIDNLASTSFAEVFQDVGLDSISYAPPTAIVPIFNWPTLGSMIDSGKRLVTFLDNKADFATVPYIIDGTHFSPRSVNFLCL